MTNIRRRYVGLLLSVLVMSVVTQGRDRLGSASTREQASRPPSAEAGRDSGQNGTSSAATDVSGEWTITGTKREDPDPHELTMVLKQQRDAFSGMLTTNKGQFEVKDGRVKGKRITFSILMPEASITAACSGAVDGDALKATCQLPGSTIDLAGSRKKANK